MKKFATIALLATSLATSASAAITAGLEAAYLTDDQEAYWAARVGWEFKATASLSHQLEFELGHTEHAEGDFGLTWKTKLTPFTLNYRAETIAAGKLGFYFGAGVGSPMWNTACSPFLTTRVPLRSRLSSDLITRLRPPPPCIWA